MLQLLVRFCLRIIFLWKFPIAISSGFRDINQLIYFSEKKMWAECNLNLYLYLILIPAAFGCLESLNSESSTRSTYPGLPTMNLKIFVWIQNNYINFGHDWNQNDHQLPNACTAEGNNGSLFSRSFPSILQHARFGLSSCFFSHGMHPFTHWSMKMIKAVLNS